MRTAAHRRRSRWLARTGCTTTTDHHYVFPARRRRPARRRDRGGARGRAALPPDPRVDGPRREPGRPAAGPRRRGHRRDPGRDRRGAIDRHHDPSPDSMLRIGVAPCSPFSVTGDLLKQAAALARRQGRAAAHPPRRDHRRGRLLPRAVRLLAGRVHRVARLARPRRLVRPRGPPRRRRDRAARRPPAPASRTARRPTPGSAPASPGPATCATPACRSGSASTVRRPTRRPRCVEELRHARAVRPGRGRTAGADGPRRAGAGHARAARGCSAGGRDRLARAGQARRPRALAARHAARTPTSPTRSPRWCSGRRRRWSCCWSRAGRSSSSDAMVTVDEDELAGRGRDVQAPPSPSAAGQRPSDRRPPTDLTERTPTGPRARRRRRRSVASARARCGRTATLKVTGEFAYGSDLWMDDMLWGVTLRSPHPYARIRRVDIGRGARDRRGASRSSPHDDVPGEQRLRPRASPTSRCWRSTSSATRASRSRWSPPTTPRSPGRRPRRSSSTTTCSSRSPTREALGHPTRPLHDGPRRPG